MNANGALRIDVWSDVVCPWCWIGKRRLEAALAGLPEIRHQIRWRAFELNPWLPAGGMDRNAYLERKFGGPDGARATYSAIEAAGAGAGLPFRFDAIARMPNTRDAHRLLAWAADGGDQDALCEALFEAFFSRGDDVGGRGTLARVAEACGLDGGEVRAVLESERFGAEVEAEDRLLRDAGMAGVPCFVFAGSEVVPGAASPEAFRGVLQRVSGAAPGEAA